MSAKNVLETKRKNGDLRLKPKGDLVASRVDAQRLSLMKALEEGSGNVILDLGSAQQVDSLGITLVLGLFKSCQKQGFAFSVEGVSPDILRVFRLFNLQKFFPIREA